MEKLIYTLWDGRGGDRTERDAYCRSLRGPVTGELAAAGARGVQVCVDDDAVADAQIRPCSFDEPVAAVVAVWLDRCHGPEYERVEEILRANSAALAGYLVTESVPLPMPRPGAPDERIRGFTGVALLRRPERIDPEHWRSRWQDHHTQLAIDIQGTFGYVQNLVVRAVTSDAPPLAAIVEEQFPDAATKDMYVFYGVDRSGDGAKDELHRRMREMQESTSTFGASERIDVIPSSRYQTMTPAFT